MTRINTDIEILFLISSKYLKVGKYNDKFHIAYFKLPFFIRENPRIPRNPCSIINLDMVNN